MDGLNRRQVGCMPWPDHTSGCRNSPKSDGRFNMAFRTRSFSGRPAPDLFRLIPAGLVAPFLRIDLPARPCRSLPACPGWLGPTEFSRAPLRRSGSPCNPCIWRSRNCYHLSTGFPLAGKTMSCSIPAALAGQKDDGQGIPFEDEASAGSIRWARRLQSMYASSDGHSDQ